jgi:sodium/proline symporter
MLGMQSIWIAFGCVLGVILIWFLLAKRLRNEAENTGALTISSLLARKIPGSERLIGMLSASIVVFFFLFYIEAQFYGGGKILHDTFGLDPIWGCIIGSVIVVFYSMMGGFITVVATDVFQAILMIITLIVLPVFLLFYLASHNIELIQTISNSALEYKSITAGKTGIPAFLLILSGMSWTLGFFGQPQLLSRMMAIRNEKEIKPAKWTAAIWTIIAYSGALMIGFTGFVLMKNGVFDSETVAKLGNVEESGQELILAVLINMFFVPVVGGLLLSGAVSAMMSTASSEIIVSSASITEDMYGNISKKKMNVKRELMFNRLVTLGVGLLALLLALTVKDSVYGLVSYAWSGIGSSFGPALILLLFWKKFSRAGIIASLISGTVGTIVWKMFFEESTQISERLTSFVFALLMAWIFAKIFPEKERI